MLLVVICFHIFLCKPLSLRAIWPIAPFQDNSLLLVLKIYSFFSFFSIFPKTSMDKIAKFGSRKAWIITKESIFVLTDE